MSGAGSARTVVAAVLLALLGAACQEGGGTSAAGEEPLLVAAAADARPAFEKLGETFEAETGQRVVFWFGSSGQLAQQIIEGASADVYAAANSTFVSRVLTAGRGDPESRTTYAMGRVAIWARGEAWGGWETLADVVGDPQVRSLAIANPEHAPYGTAAREALESAGLWDDVEARVVYGENVADAFRMAASGNADVALVAVSLAVAGDAPDDGRWRLVPDQLHRPLRQDLIVVAEQPDRAALARRFVDHVTSRDGREVLRRHGFVLGDGAAPPSAASTPSSGGR